MQKWISGWVVRQLGVLKDYWLLTERMLVSWEQEGVYLQLSCYHIVNELFQAQERAETVAVEVATEKRQSAQTKRVVKEQEHRNNLQRWQHACMLCEATHLQTKCAIALHWLCEFLCLVGSGTCMCVCVSVFVCVWCRVRQEEEEWRKQVGQEVKIKELRASAVQRDREFQIQQVKSTWLHLIIVCSQVVAIEKLRDAFLDYNSLIPHSH